MQTRIVLAVIALLWAVTASLAQLTMTGAGGGFGGSGSPALSCSYTPVTTGTQSVAYTGATPSASGGTPSYTFSETGTLPGGLSISSSTGVISGTPSANGSFPSIQVVVTDSLSNTANCGSAFTLVISPASTPITTPIAGLGSQTAPSTTAVNFYPLISGAVNGNSVTNNREQPISIAGSISNLFASFPSGIGSGNWSVALSHNGVITGLTCPVSGTTCSDTNAGHAVTIAPGDTVGWVTCPGTISGTTCTPGTAPTSNTNVQVSAEFVGANNNESFVVGASGVPSLSVFNFASPQGFSGFTTTEGNFSAVMPVAGTLDQLFVDLSVASGSGKSWTFTIMQNGVATTLVCTAVNATSCTPDLVDSITVSAGDTISFQTCPGTVSGGVCTTTTPASASLRWGMRWKPTTAGQSLLLMVDQVTMPAPTATAFSYVNGTASAGGNEINNQNIGALSFTIKNLIASFSTAPGAAQSRTFTLRSGTGGSQTNSALTCNVTNSTSVTSCQDTTHTASITQGLFLDWSAAETGTPAVVTNYKVSAVMTVP